MFSHPSFFFPSSIDALQGCNESELSCGRRCRGPEACNCSSSSPPGWGGEVAVAVAVAEAAAVAATRGEGAERATGSSPPPGGSGDPISGRRS